MREKSFSDFIVIFCVAINPSILAAVRQLTQAFTLIVIVAHFDFFMFVPPATLLDNFLFDSLQVCT